MAERRLESLLWIVSGLCIAVLAWSAGNALWAGQAAGLLGSTAMQSAAAQIFKPGVELGASGLYAPENGAVIGRLEIPALNLVVPISAGIEDKSLLRGVGYVPGTAHPGGLGTMVLAGHRDTYLRPLEHIQMGMDIRVTEGHGIFHYMVDRWEVVQPNEVDSIAIKNKPELALVTCYPFHYVGPAPKRFIVHAHLTSLLADK